METQQSLTSLQGRGLGFFSPSPPHPLGSMLGKWQGAQDQKKKLERPKRKKPTKEEGIDYRSPGFRNVTFTERISRRLTFDSLGIRGTGGEVETGIWFGFWRWWKKRAWRTEVGSAAFGKRSLHHRFSHVDFSTAVTWSFWI